MSDSFEKLKAQKDEIVRREREKLLAPLKSKLRRAKEALDLLALALTEHNHQWTPEQRAAYDSVFRDREAEKTAIRQLRADGMSFSFPYWSLEGAGRVRRRTQ
jgi:hypothetical protein